MVRQITRKCDFCGKDVNPYGVGIVTLYREIRIGAGSRFVEHLDGLNTEKSKDADAFSKGYIGCDDKEFIFCSLEHCLQFIYDIHQKTMSALIETEFPVDVDNNYCDDGVKRKHSVVEFFENLMKKIKYELD